MFLEKYNQILQGHKDVIYFLPNLHVANNFIFPPSRSNFTLSIPPPPTHTHTLTTHTLSKRIYRVVDSGID